MLKTSSIETTCMSCFGQLNSPGALCPLCGYHEAAQAAAPHQLRPRTILNGKYLLGRVLGEGGFGITYIGWDLNLDLKVAIKEYYPSGCVTRETTATSTVQPFTGSQGDYFIKGRERFINEAKSLAKFFSLPGIVSVKDYFQENGTTYISMEYIDGQTLKDYLAQMGGRLPAAQVFDMMKPVMTSLAEVHKSGIIHRDISPDNIMISKEGYMKLLDFGAAREFEDSGNKSMSIMLKPGFAPEEQYRTKGEQGPWTDVYALSATIYKCITGVTPVESLDRLHGEVLSMPLQMGIALSPAQEAAIMKGMAVRQNDRFQSVMELYNALYGSQAGVQTAIAAMPPATANIPSSAPAPVPETKKNWFGRHKFLSGVLSVVAALVLLIVIFGGDDTSGTNLANNPEMAVVIDFPDPNFEAAVREAVNKPSGGITKGDVARVTTLNVAQRGIADLSGIEHFTALKTLYCYENILTVLDVSRNTALLELGCSSNRLTELDLSANTALSWLNCGGNQLTELNLQNNTGLTWLSCANNQLSELDLSSNTKLTQLAVNNNNLSALDVSKLTGLELLWCNVNQLTGLDVSKNKKLSELDCGANQLVELDLSINTALERLWCGGNQLTGLDLSNNTKLTQLYCEKNLFPDISVIVGLDESKLENFVFDPQN